MRSNSRGTRAKVQTHEGQNVFPDAPYHQLKAAVMTNLLFEDSFYESGAQTGERIAELVPKCSFDQVAGIARQARTDMNLRHVPLFLVVQLLRNRSMWSETPRKMGQLVADVIQRADEMAELLSMYWKDHCGEAPVAKQLKLGLKWAFEKFSPFQLAKYQGRGREVTLRTVQQMVHPKPSTTELELTYAAIKDGTLKAPDTWEKNLSQGADKHDTFVRLIEEGKLGGLAMLRNLRNMYEAGVHESLVRKGLMNANFGRVLPFRFIAAARVAPQYEHLIETAMLEHLHRPGIAPFAGTTAIVVDTSPSMWMDKISAKSDMTRFEAAAALAILTREVCENVNIYAFNQRAYRIPSRHGFALRDALAATRDGASCGNYGIWAANRDGYDRILVLTDGEWHRANPGIDPYKAPPYQWTQNGVLNPTPPQDLGYMLRMHVYENIVERGKWTTIEGWSESILDYMSWVERGHALVAAP